MYGNIRGMKILLKCTLVFGWGEPFGKRGGYRWTGKVRAG